MIELAVYRLKAPCLRKQGIGEDFGVADRLRLQRAADADQPLLLLGRPCPARDDALNTVLDACLVRNERIADRSLAHKTDDVGSDVGVAYPAVG